MRIARATIVLTTAVAVAGCSADGLRDLKPQGSGPDEFSVLPVKPLTQPQDYQFLPAPTPGGANITDPKPIEDAVIALGGNAAAMSASKGIPASDKALVVASSRYGVPPNTRQELAEEDAAFRKRKRRFSSLKLFRVDRYADVYRPQSIDPHDQTLWWRRRGYETPSAPPP